MSCKFQSKINSKTLDFFYLQLYQSNFLPPSPRYYTCSSSQNPAKAWLLKKTGSLIIMLAKVLNHNQWIVPCFPIFKLPKPGREPEVYQPRVVHSSTLSASACLVNADISINGRRLICLCDTRELILSLFTLPKKSLFLKPV